MATCKTNFVQYLGFICSGIVREILWGFMRKRTFEATGHIRAVGKVSSVDSCVPLHEKNRQRKPVKSMGIEAATPPLPPDARRHDGRLRLSKKLSVADITLRHICESLDALTACRPPQDRLLPFVTSTHTHRKNGKIPSKRSRFGSRTPTTTQRDPNDRKRQTQTIRPTSY